MRIGVAIGPGRTLPAAASRRSGSRLAPRYRTFALRLALALPLLGLEAAAATSAMNAIARGDDAYDRRSEGHRDQRAQAGPIAEAIAAYEEALAMDPTRLDAREGLLRALFFEGDYVLDDNQAKLDVFARGQELGEEGISMMLAGTDFDRRGQRDFERLIDHLRSEPNAPGIYYWTAVHWGVWGRHRGKIAAAREGVAGKVRDYALIVNALDSDYLGGSGHRMLGRLHAEAPKIPFVTGWIDRSVAVSELETARSLSSDSLTLLYFIEALLDFAPARRDEALKLLRDLMTRRDGPFASVEDARAVAEAGVLFDKLAG